jgi:hypothetical protein
MWEVVVYDSAAGDKDEIASLVKGALGASGAHDVAGDSHSGYPPREIREEIDEHLAGVEADLNAGAEVANDQIEVVDQFVFQEDGDGVLKFGQVRVLTAESESQSDVEAGAAGGPDSLDDLPEQA